MAKKAHIDLEPALKKHQKPEHRSSGIGGKHPHISKELTLDELPEVTVEEHDDYLYDKDSAAMDQMKKASTTRAKFTRSSENFNSLLSNADNGKRDEKKDM